MCNFAIKLKDFGSFDIFVSIQFLSSTHCKVKRQFAFISGILWCGDFVLSCGLFVFLSHRSLLSTVCWNAEDII